LRESVLAAMTAPPRWRILEAFDGREEVDTRRNVPVAAGAVVAVAATVLLMWESASGPGPAGKSGSSARVVLDLAVTEAPGKPAALLADAFAERVDALSHGALAVSVRSWQAEPGSHSPVEDAEAGAIAAVRGGAVQLAVVPSDAFEARGVTSLRALQAPFVVATPEVAERATSGAIAELLERGLTAVSLTGLALVPEGMERPFGFLKPLVTPADFAEVRIRADSSPTTRAVLRALGARPVDIAATGSDTAVYSGFANDVLTVPRAGDEFPKDAYTAGNVALFPRVDAVVASSGAFVALRPGQRSILRRAAVEARAQLLRTTSEAAAAAAFCRAGGTVVQASSSEQRALRAKVGPLLARMRRAPGSGALVARLERIRVSRESSVGACGPSSVERPPEFDADIPRWLELGLRPPAGSFRRVFTPADLRAAGADEDDARNNAGVTTLTFYGAPFSLRFVLEWQGASRPPCRGRIEFVHRRTDLHWNPTTPCSGLFAFRPRRAANGDLTLLAFDPMSEPRWRARAYAGTWTRVDCNPNGGWPGPPPEPGRPRCAGDPPRPPWRASGEVAYSPDGAHVVFELTVEKGGTVAALFRANLDGGAAKAITPYRPPPGRCPCDFDLSFSPDGTRVAFVRRAGDGRTALFVVGVDGTGLRQVTSWTRRTGGDVEWSAGEPRLVAR
jgi:TRAP-type C4-dicarboxylate transport system substrate-binding protein